MEEDSVPGDAAGNGRINSGAAYVFRRSGSGVWTEEVILKASNASATDRFGEAVAIHGDRLLVRESDSNRGEVFWFTKSGPTWNEDRNERGVVDNARFGEEVSVFGEFSIVGRPGLDDAVNFYRDPGPTTWEHTGGEGFGEDVHIFGDHAVVGATLVASERGSVFLYEWDGLAWIAGTAPALPVRDTGDQLGFAVAGHGDELVAGMPFEDSATTDPADDSAPNAGAAYVLRP